MANHKANEPRVRMLIPVSFHAKVMSASQERKMNATVFLEKATVIYNEG